jgi:hypothetical protein
LKTLPGVNSNNVEHNMPYGGMRWEFSLNEIEYRPFLMFPTRRAELYQYHWFKTNFLWGFSQNWRQIISAWLLPIGKSLHLERHSKRVFLAEACHRCSFENKSGLQLQAFAIGIIVC